MDRLSHKYFLTAGESDAEGYMPLTLVAERIIEVATEHANSLGIGYATLITRNLGWVLSRLSIEMKRFPAINEEYCVTTWIETYNRRFSERNFEFTDASGAVIGYARTVWVPMNFATRTLGDISEFGPDSFPAVDLPCPIERTPRLEAAADAEEEQYTFRYCDLDFNRHVNTVRYIDLILNHWPLEQYDTHIISRFDIIFHQECHFGDTVTLRVDGSNVCTIVRPDGKKAVAARIIFSGR